MNIIAVITVEMHHQLLHCAHVCCLISIDVQQVLTNVNGCHLFHVEEFSFTPLLHMYRIQPLLSYHQHLHLMLWANVIKSEALLSELPLYYQQKPYTVCKRSYNHRSYTRMKTRKFRNYVPRSHSSKRSKSASLHGHGKTHLSVQTWRWKYKWKADSLIALHPVSVTKNSIGSVLLY